MLPYPRLLRLPYTSTARTLIGTVLAASYVIKAYIASILLEVSGLGRLIFVEGIRVALPKSSNLLRSRIVVRLLRPLIRGIRRYSKTRRRRL